MSEETHVTLTKVPKRISDTDVDSNVMRRESLSVSEINGHIKNSVSKYDSTNDGKEKKKKKKHGCCGGRSEASNKTEMIGITKLFQFATCFDIFLMVIGTIGAAALGTAFPINIATFGDVIDVFVDSDINKMMNITNSKPIQEEILPFVYQFIGLGVGAFITGYFGVSCWQWAAERQVSTMRKQFFHSVLRQDIGWFDVHEAGEISNKFSEDISKIAEGMGDKMAIFIQWVTTWLASYIMAFTRSWKLTLVVIIVSPILILVGAVVVRVMRKMASEEAKAYAKAGAIAEQALRAIRTVQAFQGQEKEVTRYGDNLSLAVQVASRKGLALGLGMSIIWFLLFLMFSETIWFGIYLIQENNLQPGKILPVSIVFVYLLNLILNKSYKNSSSSN